MNRFEGIQFQGTFRSYQQRVLDNAEQYLADGKVNIVAAPGSGKTVLGLELIRKLDQPCLILSPTTAIREQWGQRFRELFLKDESRFEELFSTDLQQVKLVNSITYQALYTAMDYGSSINVRRLLRKHKIKTICLDEAHHLKNEWQRALEKLKDYLEADVKIISLTATPPYDSDGGEWKRYYDMCGEIDEEIFVPELVAQETLCPHQDYVYFNYPTQKEVAALREYEEHVWKAVAEVGRLEGIQCVVSEVNAWNSTWGYSYIKASYPKEFVALLVLLQYYGISMDKKRIKTLTGKSDLPKPEISYFQTALQFLVDYPHLFMKEEQKEEILQVLRKNQVYSKKKVNLVLNESLRKSLISSVGKLKSIRDIAMHEYRTMGKSLRMLVLTDYIHSNKENLSRIGEDEEFNSVNVVSIFETLRRTEETMDIGVLSGSLIILPEAIELQGVMLEKEPLLGTRYCIVDMAGATHEAVTLVSQLFREGKLQILIGTKSLLGEGWDEPCINSLILASFVGSFVSSNQMRGRAIRRDKDNPDKTANIWHLVTLEPGEVVAETGLERLAAADEESKNYLNSCDFEIVRRRFDTFMGPNYETGEIESGISRITLIRPPFDANGIVRINREMLELSEEREAMREMWDKQLGGKKFSVVMEATMAPERTISAFFITNKYGFALDSIAICYAFLAMASIEKMIRVVHAGGIGLTSGELTLNMVHILCILIVGAVIFCLWAIVTIRRLKHLTPAHSLKTMGKVLEKTLTECGIISSGGEVHVEKRSSLKKGIAIQLRNASMHDQNIFNTAITEMLSPIDNPRYLLIRKGHQYECSFACPTVIGRKKKYVEILARYMKENMGTMEAVRTNGWIREQCRIKSFVSKEGGPKTMLLPGTNKKYIVAQEKNFHE